MADTHGYGTGVNDKAKLMLPVHIADGFADEGRACLVLRARHLLLIDSESLNSIPDEREGGLNWMERGIQREALLK